MPSYLYIHVPFCVKKCLYCDFISFPFDDSSAGNYLEALIKEITIRSTRAEELETIYVGGGTPSLMPERFLGDLFLCLHDSFTFSHHSEITIEANPGTLCKEKLALFHSSGVNRISLGAQSFQDGELKALGRIHTAQQAATSLKLARGAGFENISLDLMYGVPGQTCDTWKDTLRRAVELGPTHISAYELTPEKGTPLVGLLEKRTMELPDEEDVLAMYDYAIDYLSARGYEQYEISNFSLSGYRCRHNLNYWNRGEYLAAGAGAHSFSAGIRSRNTARLSTYIERLRAGTLPEEESLQITRFDEMRERLFLGLRKTEGIPVPDSEEGSDLLAAAGELIEKGYLNLADNRLRLTRKGIVLSNTVIVSLFENLGL
jgi:oxygen-independent coproporphyrinogen-3 oxidase